MARLKVTKSGHITIPKKIRDAKNSTTGTILEIEHRNDVLILRAAEGETSEQSAETDPASTDHVGQVRRN